MADEFSFSAEDLNQELEDELNSGEEFSAEDVEELKIEGVPKHRPSFPLVTFASAVLIDTVNIFTGGFVGIITGIIAFILVRIYLIGKYGSIKRWIWRRALIRLGVKSIPVLGALLLSWSWFVWRAHAKNYKRIDQVLRAVEQLLLKKAKA